MRRAAIALMLLVTLLATAVPLLAGTGGQDVQAVFHEFNLFGTWAVDCMRPAALDNPHVTDMMVSPGVVLERHDLGPDSEINHYSILAAERLSKTRLDLRVIFRPGKEGEERQHIEVVVSNGLRRTVFNQPEGEPVRVRDGKVVGFGLKTPLLRKCE